MAEPLWKRLQGVADRRTRVFRRSFIEAVERALSSPSSRAALEAAVRRGDWSAAYELAVAAWARASDRWRKNVAADVGALFSTSGALTYKSLKVRGTFNAINPLALAWVDQHVATLVTGVTKTTQEAIRAVIRRSLAGGEFDARQSARLIRELGIGLTDRQAAAVMNRRRALLDAGTSQSAVDTMTARYRLELLKDRAEAIARTETITATNAGQIEAWLQAQGRGLLGAQAQKQWVVTPDDRLCPFCASMRNQVRLLTEPFVCPVNGATVNGPTLHPRCRCAIRLVPGAVRSAA